MATNTFGLAKNRVIPGFEHISRRWDKSMETYVAKILPGEFYVSRCGDVISTVLGSCVSACIRDRNRGIGGMNHFMLPISANSTNAYFAIDKAGEAARYGNWAMEMLINEILKLGGRKDCLEVKVFGGGKILQSSETSIGLQNIEFIKDFLRKEGLTISAIDTGGIWPRKLLFFPTTGKVKVKKMKAVSPTAVVKRERDYIRDFEKPKADVELF